MMKTKTTFSLLAIASLALSGVAFAGGKTYQATGQVVKVSASMVVIQSGTQKWEIARDTNTKVKGDLKKGNTVTVTYTMNATAMDVKAMPAAPAAPHQAGKAAPAKKAAPPKLKAFRPGCESRRAEKGRAERAEKRTAKSYSYSYS